MYLYGFYIHDPFYIYVSVLFLYTIFIFNMAFNYWMIFKKGCIFDTCTWKLSLLVIAKEKLHEWGCFIQAPRSKRIKVQFCKVLICNSKGSWAGSPSCDINVNTGWLQLYFQLYIQSTASATTLATTLASATTLAMKRPCNKKLGSWKVNKVAYTLRPRPHISSPIQLQDTCQKLIHEIVRIRACHSSLAD